MPIQSQGAIELMRAGDAKRTGLPVDLLEDLPRRIRFWCVALIVAGAVNVVVAELTGLSFNRTVRYGGLAVAWLVTLGLYSLARAETLPLRRLLQLALGYEVFLAAVASLWTAELVWFAGAPNSLGLSPVALLIVLYPVVIPGTARGTMIAAGAAASAELVVVFSIAAVGLAPMPASAMFVRHGCFNAVAAVLAIAVSRVVYRYGERLAAARQLGSYELEALLGEGGMGEVWRASHRLLARPAAVKLIHPETLAGPDEVSADKAVQRFEREAQATAALRSPHTIDLYDFGRSRDGTLYYAMELLEGLDLETLVEQHGPQPPERVVHLLRQACHSLHEAHEAGILHRDIKPANLFLCRYGTDLDFVKVLDFGLARQLGLEDLPPLESTRGGAGRLTEAGKTCGTAWYMAPEAILAMDDVDRRVDIYALGCVGYWLLTGVMVFEESTKREAARAHVERSPIRVSERDSRGVPEGLDRIVMQCLEKDRTERPQDAEALSRMLADLDLERLWTPARAAEWWERFEEEAKGNEPEGRAPPGVAAGPTR